MDRPGDGSRGGARRAAPERDAAGGRRTALLGLGAVAAGAAWAGLVVAAIRFGLAGRDGESAAWFFLALAALGAVACLFVALMLGWRAAQAVGVARDAGAAAPPAGGKRSAGRRARR